MQGLVEDCVAAIRTVRDVLDADWTATAAACTYGGRLHPQNLLYEDIFQDEIKFFWPLPETCWMP